MKFFFFQIDYSTHRLQTQLSAFQESMTSQQDMTSRVSFDLRAHQVLGERQYRLLQSHVIRLNNSLQDIQETLSRLKNVKVNSDECIILHSKRWVI